MVSLIRVRSGRDRGCSLHAPVNVHLGCICRSDGIQENRNLPLLTRAVKGYQRILAGAGNLLRAENVQDSGKIERDAEIRLRILQQSRDGTPDCGVRIFCIRAIEIQCRTAAISRRCTRLASKPVDANTAARPIPGNAHPSVLARVAHLAGALDGAATRSLGRFSLAW